MLSENDPLPKHAIVSPIVKGVTGNYESASSSVAKSRSSSFKRVSFGNAKGNVVETFIYESVPTTEDDLNRFRSTPAAPSTPTKVRVELVESQIPSCIAPPAEVSVVTDGGNVAAAASSSSSSSEHHHHHVGVLTTQPQLPSLRKMDDHENPFRPDGRLSHEVDPIVEVYKKRPYPPGSSNENEDVVETVNVSRIQQQQHAQNITTTDFTDSSSKSKTVAVAASGTGSSVIISKRDSSKNGGAPVKPTDIKLNMSDGSTTATVTTTVGGTHAAAQSADVQHKLLSSPKAGRVEVVHLEEKKKRCACCVVQ